MPSEPARDSRRPIGGTRRGAGPTRRALSFLRRGTRIAAVNLLILVVLLIPLELWFGRWLDGPGAISMLDANPGRVEVRSSTLYPAGTTITNSRDRYGFRGGAGDPGQIDVLVLGGSTTAARL